MSNRGKAVIQEEEEEEASRNSEDLVKAEIVSHPLFNDLLAAHVACVRFATPIDQQHIINSQIASHVPMTYTWLFQNSNQELDQFMTCYTTMISSLDKQSRHCTMEAKTTFQSIEMELFHLTGAKVEEEIKAQLSDLDDDVHENDQGSLDIASAGNEDTVAFGSSFPTGFQRSLTERTKHELRLNLQQGLKDYEMKIKHVREEILRKRRASKLPSDTSILKRWWEEHSDWPYPTEEEKEMFIMETGLKLKQINRWFTNQRNRNWD